MIPPLVADDYLAAFLALLPRGRAWSRDRAATMARVCGALMPSYERNTQRAAALVVDAFPATAVELLPEWEATLGLPDPCLEGVAQTVEERQRAAVARLAGDGGQSPDYFAHVASLLGYAVTVTEFAPFRFGMPMGLPLCGEDWAHAWRVNAPSFTVRPFRFGSSDMGDPFATWGNTALQCTLRRLAPAHTTLLFSYS